MLTSNSTSLGSVPLLRVASVQPGVSLARLSTTIGDRETDRKEAKRGVSLHVFCCLLPLRTIERDGRCSMHGIL